MDLTVAALLASLISALILLRRWKNFTLEKSFTNFWLIPGTFPTTCFQMNLCVLCSISEPALILYLPWSRLNCILQILVISTTAGEASRSFPLDLLAMKDPGVGSIVGSPSLTANQLATESIPDRHLSWSISSVSMASSPSTRSGMIVSSSSVAITGAFVGTNDSTWLLRHQTLILRQNSAALGWQFWPPYPRIDEKQFSSTSWNNISIRLVGNKINSNSIIFYLREASQKM